MDQFVLAPVPVDGMPAENAHRLSVPECLMLRRVVALELRDDVLLRLRAAVPDLEAAGTKCVLRRAPTDDELAKLRAAAEWYGYPFVANIRAADAFTLECRLFAARRNGRWNP